MNDVLCVPSFKEPVLKYITSFKIYVNFSLQCEGRCPKLLLKIRSYKKWHGNILSGFLFCNNFGNSRVLVDPLEKFKRLMADEPYVENADGTKTCALIDRFISHDSENFPVPKFFLKHLLNNASFAYVHIEYMVIREEVLAYLKMTGRNCEELEEHFKWVKESDKDFNAYLDGMTRHLLKDIDVEAHLRHSGIIK